VFIAGALLVFQQVLVRIMAGRRGAAAHAAGAVKAS
jgi:nitric oxide reductase subunit B